MEPELLPATATELEPAQRRTDLRGGPEIDRRAVLREALQQRSPVAGAARVQLCSCRGSVVGQSFDVENAGGVGEPVAPQRAGVAEDVELDRQSHRPYLRQSETPSATPTASIRTS